MLNIPFQHYFTSFYLHFYIDYCLHSILWFCEDKYWWGLLYHDSMGSYLIECSVDKGYFQGSLLCFFDIIPFVLPQISGFQYISQIFLYFQFTSLISTPWANCHQSVPLLLLFPGDFNDSPGRSIFPPFCVPSQPPPLLAHPDSCMLAHNDEKHVLSGTYKIGKKKKHLNE